MAVAIPYLSWPYILQGAPKHGRFAPAHHTQPMVLQSTQENCIPISLLLSHRHITTTLKFLKQHSLINAKIKGYTSTIQSRPERNSYSLIFQSFHSPTILRFSTAK